MKIVAYGLSLALLAGCVAAETKSETSPAAAAQSPQAAIEAALASNKQADALGYEWRDAGKIIKQAQEAADKGDAETALKLAKKAQKQGEFALKQAEEQKNPAPRF